MLSLSKHARWVSLWALASCSQPVDNASAGDKILCAIGSAEFADVCTVERAGSSFVIHRPDGGFRRFEMSGNEVTALDGADPVTVTPISDGVYELGIDGDRYQLVLWVDAPRP